MSQPLPEFGPEFMDRAVMAEMLSIDPSGINPAYPLQVVSCGMPFLFVPLKDLATIRQVKLRLDVWEHELKDFACPHLFVFTHETELKKSFIVECSPGFRHCRRPGGRRSQWPLGCYLVKYDRRPQALIAAAARHFVSEQGLKWASQPDPHRDRAGGTGLPRSQSAGSAFIWAKDSSIVDCE
jgi:trans-2,3-dihydro-3-hydroxyanthranilate isomerase